MQVLAAALGNEEVMEKLCGRCGDAINDAVTGRMTALHHAAQEGHDKIVGILLRLGADVNAEDSNGNTPLLVATRQGHLDVATRLLQRSKNAFRSNISGENIWDFVFNSKNLDFSEALAQKYCSELVQQTSGKTWQHDSKTSPLHTAVANGDAGALNYWLNLLRQQNPPISPNVVDEHDETFFHLAARKNFAGAFVDATDRPSLEARNVKGETALHVACKNDSVAAFDGLLALGASVEQITTDKKQTVLHLAAKSAGPKLLQKLITLIKVGRVFQLF